jgi:hypothetical protein
MDARRCRGDRAIGALKFVSGSGSDWSFRSERYGCWSVNLRLTPTLVRTGHLPPFCWLGLGMAALRSPSSADAPERRFGAVPAISAQACARAFARAFARARAILSSIARDLASSRARRTVGLLGAAPSSGAKCASSAMSLMLVAPSATAAAIDASTQ